MNIKVCHITWPGLSRTYHHSKTKDKKGHKSTQIKINYLQFSVPFVEIFHFSFLDLFFPVETEQFKKNYLIFQHS